MTARNEDGDVLAATLDGLRESSAGVRTEIVLVDDASLPPIDAIAADVRQVRHAVPVGVSQARRTGAATASGDVLCWLDGHMTFADGWLEAMLEHADSGAFLCSVYCDYERASWRCFGADLAWSGERDYARQLVPGFGFELRTAVPAAATVDVPVAIGGCYMMRRDSYERCGGFSPFFRVWGVDEQDVSVRAWVTGCGVKCVTSADVGHLWRPSFPYPVQFNDIELNQLILLRAVFEEETVARLLPAYLPVPVAVEAQLAAMSRELVAWRAAIQTNRVLSDAVFFERFLPELLTS